MQSMSWFRQDLRYGVRALRKDRGFALLAMFALALGIGATTVIFSVLDNVLLEPFPYKGADRLAGFFIHDKSRADEFGRGGFFIGKRRHEIIRRLAGTLEHIAAVIGAVCHLITGG